MMKQALKQPPVSWPSEKDQHAKDSFWPVFGIVAVLALSLNLVAIAPAVDADNDRLSLIHVGQNPSSCGTMSGSDSGSVTVRFNPDRKRLKINVSVHDALPNTSYVVDIRCVGTIGRLTTNSRGYGRTLIDVARSMRPSDEFFIDISVFNGIAYGDTFIAGPFDLN